MNLFYIVLISAFVACTATNFPTFATLDEMKASEWREYMDSVYGLSTFTSDDFPINTSTFEVFYRSLLASTVLNLSEALSYDLECPAPEKIFAPSRYPGGGFHVIGKNHFWRYPYSHCQGRGAAETYANKNDPNQGEVRRLFGGPEGHPEGGFADNSMVEVQHVEDHIKAHNERHEYWM